ncbi:MAG: site-specific integrase [Flavobacterium sp.]
MEARISNLFYIRRAKANSKGLVPIFHRVTVDGKRIKDKSTRKYIDPSKWSDKEEVTGTSEEARTINRYLTELKNEVLEAERHLHIKKEKVEPGNMKNKLLKIDDKPRTIIPIFQDHNNRIKALIPTGEFAPGTLERYETSLSHTIEFLIWKFNIRDIDIKKIDYAFIMDYDFYLRSERGCNNNTTVKYLKNFQKIINICLKNKWISDDPFAFYNSKIKEVEIEYLTQSEIELIINKRFVSDRLSEVRDIFIFCCFTGLAYIDVKQLDENHIGFGIDGNKWIFKNRQKTETASHIPILPIAQEIIDKYKDHPICLNSNIILPVKSNQKMNSYLKEIADVCGVNKKLTFHVARYTFATTVTLSNGIPIESVSKMLGHKNIRMTQHYAKVVDRKVSQDMAILKDKFSSSLLSKIS